MRPSFRYLLLVFCLFPFSSELAAQEKFTPEEQILHDKIVQLIFDFDPVEWEQLKTELRYKTFPIYSLTYEAIREAYFINRRDESYVFSEEDGPEVVENRFEHYRQMRWELDWNTYVVGEYLEKIVKLRVKEDYDRLQELLDDFRPRIPDKDKLVLTLNKDRSVKSIGYTTQAKNHKPLPEHTQTALLSFLKEKKYHSYERTEYIQKPNLFWLKNKFQNLKYDISRTYNKSLKRKLKRFKRKLKRIFS